MDECGFDGVALGTEECFLFCHDGLPMQRDKVIGRYSIRWWGCSILKHRTAIDYAEVYTADGFRIIGRFGSIDEAEAHIVQLAARDYGRIWNRIRRWVSRS